MESYGYESHMVKGLSLYLRMFLFYMRIEIKVLINEYFCLVC